MFLYRMWVIGLLCFVLSHSTSLLAQNMDELRYDITSDPLTTVYVDPVNGSDSNSGNMPSLAFKTLTRAWNGIPQRENLSRGIHILILPGIIDEQSIPNYMEYRYGTRSAPIIIQAANGKGTVILGGDLNIFDSRYIYLLDLVVRPNPAGDAYHCEQCDHILIRNCELNGGQRQAHETVKINQSQHVYIEDSNIHGAEDNAIDFVAVQYGHVARNQIHNAQDWCMYAKGGSSYLRIEGNEFYGCGTGGVTAGQGTGFEFMVSPWLRYEAYNLKIINNVIHDTEGAGLGVNGGYNILLAHNTLYRVGSRSHALEIVFGLRSCDGNSAACQTRLNSGGWGTAVTGGAQEAFIGNKNIFVYNNLIYNPSGFAGANEHFAIYGPRTSLSGSNVPGPVTTDENLLIRGNIIYNNPSTASLGVNGESGCQDTNPSCNESQILSDNTINRILPEMVNPSGGDFRPTGSSNILNATTFNIPSFPERSPIGILIEPEGNLTNILLRDRGEVIRSTVGPAGAYSSIHSSLLPPGGSGGGGENPGQDRSPKIKKVLCIPKKIKVRNTINCTVTASDDIKLTRVTINSSKTSIKLKKSKGIYRGKVRFKKKGKYVLTAKAIDSSQQATSKKVGTFLVTP